MPVVIMLDEPTHTIENPECNVVDCICHAEQQAEGEYIMSTHDQVTQANHEADKLWEAVPAWPVDANGDFLRDDVALVGIVLHAATVLFGDTEELPVVSK